MPVFSRGISWFQLRANVVAGGKVAKVVKVSALCYLNRFARVHYTLFGCHNRLMLGVRIICNLRVFSTAIANSLVKRTDRQYDRHS